MPNLSLRDLDSSTLGRIRSVARRRRVSVNRLIVETLQSAYAARESRHDDLDALAGAWSKSQADAFDAAVAPFAELDDRLWAAERAPPYRAKSKRRRSARR